MSSANSVGFSPPLWVSTPVIGFSFCLVFFLHSLNSRMNSDWNDCSRTLCLDLYFKWIALGTFIVHLFYSVGDWN